MEDKTLVFYHIPKTAGTTFTDILKKVYGDRSVYSISGLKFEEDIEKYKNLTDAQKQEYKVITGHLSHTLQEFMVNEPVYVVFLRNPSEQVVSSYFYTRQNKNSFAHNEIKSLKNFSEFLDWQIETNKDNMQTRYLSDTSVHQAEGLVKITDSEFSIALKRLENMQFVFITEGFDDAVLALSKSLGWPNLPSTNVLNKSNREYEISKVEKIKLEKVYKYDFMLYEHAKRMHKQNIKRAHL